MAEIELNLTDLCPIAAQISKAQRDIVIGRQIERPWNDGSSEQLSRDTLILQWLLIVYLDLSLQGRLISVEHLHIHVIAILNEDKEAYCRVAAHI